MNLLAALALVGALNPILSASIPGTRFDPGAVPAGSTPALIADAVADGSLTSTQGWLQLAYAFRAPHRVLDRFHSTVGWRGTIPLMNLQRATTEEPALLDSLVDDFGPDPIGCGFLLVSPATHRRSSEHFDVNYIPGTVRSLTVADYIDSLETSWVTEIDEFGWAAPPLRGSRYPVSIDATMIPGLYGFVASDGNAGNNPNTPGWDEGDASYSCMGLNPDYSPFPGSAQQALDATTAHEFAHSIQFGYGALSPNPTAKFSEGMATWMEDEVFDDSNDSYNYLHPNYSDPMSGTADSYEYFIVYRALTEPFDRSPGAPTGEDVFQHVVEWMSRNNNRNFIQGFEDYYGGQTQFAGAFADASGRVAFFDGCGVPDGTFCLEEGAAYPGGRAFQGTSTGTYTVRAEYASAAISLVPGPAYSASSSGGVTARLYCLSGGVVSTHSGPTTGCDRVIAVGSSGRLGGTITVS